MSEDPRPDLPDDTYFVQQFDVQCSKCNTKFVVIYIRDVKERKVTLHCPECFKKYKNVVLRLGGIDGMILELKGGSGYKVDPELQEILDRDD